MDPQDFSASRSPRRELQGPRPAPLKVRKDSHKIRKPPVAPPNPSQQQQAHQYRPPVIIYTVSPKVIHTDPREFMTLVQRLTGMSSTCSSSSLASSSSSSYPDNTGAISPAARFASIEKTRSPEKNKPQRGDISMVEGVEISREIESSSFFPGILSPGPAALPPIPPNFFSPPSDPNPLSFFHDFSPILQGNKNYMEGSFMPSPSNLLQGNKSYMEGSFMPSPSNFLQGNKSYMEGSFMPSPSNLLQGNRNYMEGSFMPSPSNFLSPFLTSPTPSLDIFNNFFDL